MPKKACIDVPGALHHIIVRGTEHRKIFYNDKDRDNFLDRLGNILTDSKPFCFAWALITPAFVVASCWILNQRMF